MGAACQVLDFQEARPYHLLDSPKKGQDTCCLTTPPWVLEGSRREVTSPLPNLMSHQLLCLRSALLPPRLA